MIRVLVLLFLSIISSFLSAQITLTTEGIIINDTNPGEWSGYNVPRSERTFFTFRNNSLTSVNSTGYILQAGDESVSSTNNNLDGEIISGNKFVWEGTDPLSITHGLFTGYNSDVIIKYNYLDRVPMGIIRKSNGKTDLTGVIAYNIIKNPVVGVVVKGINGIRIYNNTFYSTLTPSETWRGLVDIYANDSFVPAIPSTGTKIKNNIFYTRYQIANIKIYETEDLSGFESDYNVFYCEAGTPVFNYLGVLKTFAQWQALGFDTHSVVVNPDFNDFTGFVPANGLFVGTDLGTDNKIGLSANALWVAGSAPATTDQGNSWTTGACITEANHVNESPSVFILSPGNSNSFSTPADITITAAATDNDGTISKVEFYSGNTKIGEITVDPFTFTWYNVTEGNYSLTAVATDNFDAKTSSAPISISVFNGIPPVNSPPTVAIASPGTGSSFSSPATVIIIANAFDSDGIMKVEFLNGTVKLGESTSAPYLFTWTGVKTGTYFITAIATDNSMATSASKPVEVHVGRDGDFSNELINIFPNPNAGHFTVELLSPFKNEGNNISITDSGGKKVYEGKFLRDENLKQFNLSRMKPGIYTFIIIGKGIIATKRFIIN
jgi:hypothetical protein